jgi:hypothetical protein
MEVNGCDLNTVRCETSAHFRIKEIGYFEVEINELGISE